MSPRAGARLAAAAVAVVAVLGLAGCGDDSDRSYGDDPYAIPDRFQDYCDEVEDRQVQISDALAEGGEASGLIKALPSFEALAAKAPDDIADDWDVVVERIHDLIDALEQAGVDPDDYDSRRPPPGLDQDQRDAIEAAAVALVSTTTGNAMASVQQQARDVCKTPLALG